jgi:tetratricopeptide (TPR) repeat protein
VSDEIRRLSDELARDPASLVFLPLGEALRRLGQLDLALKVSVRGLERHPHNADAHDLLARIAVDRGELQRAFDEWDMVLRFAPNHAGAKKGMGFICFRQGKLVDAERYLTEALELDATDQSAIAALAHVRLALGRSPTEVARSAGAMTSPPTALPPIPPRRSGEAAARPSGGTAARAAGEPSWLAESIRNAPQPEAPSAPASVPELDSRERAAISRNPRALFADLIGDADQTALLLDADGFVLAGAYASGDGRDVAQEVGAELSGVSDEAQRAMRHFDLGNWTSIVVETEVATIALAPGPKGGLLLVAADGAMPLGMVRRFLDRCAARARAFAGGVA